MYVYRGGVSAVPSENNSLTFYAEESQGSSEEDDLPPPKVIYIH